MPAKQLTPDRNEMSATYEIVRETWLTRRPAATAGFAAATTTFTLILLSVLGLTGIFHLDEFLPASFESVYSKGEFWRAWTTVFAHADIGHLASNSLLFFILGYFLNGYFGPFIFPVAALLFGGLTNMVVLRTYQPEVSLIGASGVVYWMGGAWLVYYFTLSRQKNLTQRWLRTLGVGLAIFMPAETFQPHTSYRTHFIGFALGIAFAAFHCLFARKKFRSAEVRETIVEESDPSDDLPPPEGFGPIEPDR